NPASATDAQKQTAKNTVAVAAYKGEIRQKIGLDKNYVQQWADWTANALRGDLGESLVGKRPVTAELRRRLPASLELGGLPLLVSTLMGLPVGILSAVKQDSWLDYGTRSFAIAVLALPSFFVATIVIAVALRWQGYAFPTFYKNFWTDPSINLQLVLPPAII